MPCGTSTIYQPSADIPKYAGLEDWLEKVMSERHQVPSQGLEIKIEGRTGTRGERGREIPEGSVKDAGF